MWTRPSAFANRFGCTHEPVHEMPVSLGVAWRRGDPPASPAGAPLERRTAVTSKVSATSQEFEMTEMKNNAREGRVAS
jgi:hypothetical protein